jgi:hypothetical protein
MCRTIWCGLGLAALLLAVGVSLGEHGLAAFADDQAAPPPMPQPIPEIEIVNPPDIVAQRAPVRGPAAVDPADATIFGLPEAQPPASPPPTNQPGLAPPPGPQPPGVIPGTTPPGYAPGQPFPQGAPGATGPFPSQPAPVPLQRPDGSPQSFDELLSTLAQIRQTKVELEKQEKAVIAALKRMMTEQRERAKSAGIDLEEPKPPTAPKTPPSTPPQPN